MDTTTVSTSIGTPSVVLDRHLRLAVRTEVVESPVLADVREPARQLVSQVDRHRHEFLRLVRGVAEHHALVAGAPRSHRACRSPIEMSGDCSSIDVSTAHVS